MSPLHGFLALSINKALSLSLLPCADRLLLSIFRPSMALFTSTTLSGVGRWEKCPGDEMANDLLYNNPDIKGEIVET